jgi:hypothetical protein
MFIYRRAKPPKKNQDSGKDSQKDFRHPNFFASINQYKKEILFQVWGRSFSSSTACSGDETSASST